MEEKQPPQGRCATPHGQVLFLLWLLEQKRECQMAEVEEVLAELVATGLVLERKGKDARTRYSVDPRKLSEIRALLKEQCGEPDRKGHTSANSPVCKRITQENPSRREETP